MNNDYAPLLLPASIATLFGLLRLFQIAIGGLPEEMFWSVGEEMRMRYAEGEEDEDD